MADTKVQREARRWAIDEIRGGEHVETVEIQGYAEGCGYGTLDDIWDEDGDGIYACFQHAFMSDGYPVVRVAFPQGMDPLRVARMLRKMARMLERPCRHQISNLGLLHDDTDYARWLGDGDVGVSNLRRAIEDHERNKEDDPD
jgi:hypothetical protein